VRPSMLCTSAKIRATTQTRRSCCRWAYQASSRPQSRARAGCLQHLLCIAVTAHRSAASSSSVLPLATVEMHACITVDDESRCVGLG
jgi:hypothetical protein